MACPSTFSTAKVMIGHVGQESGDLIYQHYGQQDRDEAGREVTSQKERSKGSDVVSPRGDRVDARGERPAEEHLGTPNQITRVALHRRPSPRKSSAKLRAPPDADCRPGLKENASSSRILLFLLRNIGPCARIFCTTCATEEGAALLNAMSSNRVPNALGNARFRRRRPVA